MTTTLLAVDDSKTIRKVLQITFAGEDYKVVLAENADQALAAVQSERPAVALVDAALGGGQSGYDLCQAIKREAPGTGVIMLSSKHQPYDKARGASVGADDFMDKPFDTQQLIDKTGAVARKAAEAPAAAAAPAAAGAPPATATPYRTPAAAEPAPMQPKAARSPTLNYGGAAPAAPPKAPAAPIAAPAPAAAPRPAVPAATPAAVPAATAVATATSGNGAFAERLAGMGLTSEQVDGVLSLSREVVEQVVWEVVPQLAEAIIKEEIRRLTAE